MLILASGLAGCAEQAVDFDPQAYQTGLHSYSAGQYALSRRDTNTAADYYLDALGHDPENSYLRARAFELLVTNGRFDEARTVNKDLSPGRAAYGISRMLAVVDAMNVGDYAAAEIALSNATGTGFDGLLKPVAQAWIKAGERDQEAAMAALSDFDKKPRALQQFADEHRAMILAYMGEWEVARKIYLNAIEFSGASSPRLALDYVARLAQRGDWGEAQAVLQPLVDENPHLARLSATLKMLKEKKTAPILSGSPAKGFAEALYRLATEMLNRATAPTAIIYARLAAELRPDFDDAHYIIGDVLASQRLLEDAYRAFDEISETSLIWLPAQVRKVGLLSEMDRHDEAIPIIEYVISKYPDYAQAYVALGDIYRESETFSKALQAYNKAIEVSDVEDENNWFLYYARAICHEQLDAWPKAEADFLKALELKPDDPFVLNYLGYSWIDRGENFERGREMIERAIAQRPNDGHIVDSLGWAYYLAGEYEKAVEKLEIAVALEPGDATINDHLGDAYWRVGRTIEARFKWRQVLDLEPEQEIVSKLEQKLEQGLSLVEVQK